MKLIGITSMMDHNHSAHPRHAVKRVNAPQSIGVDAASGVAKDSGFWGRSGQLSHLTSSTEVCRHGNRETEKKQTSGFQSKKGFSQYPDVDAGYCKLRQLWILMNGDELGDATNDDERMRRWICP